MKKLYIVATPIGNLEDITYRAVKILGSVDLIYAEDTRRAKILLDRYKIKTPVRSYHQHSGGEAQIIDKIKQGISIAYISDAGTPGISDPGQKLISLAVSNNIEVEAIPGPAGVICALSISGFPTDKFVFAGFLPHKKGRVTALKKLAKEDRTIVLYESPYRIIKTLSQIRETLGDREVMVARELTKKFETVYRGKISEVVGEIKVKGEFIIVIKARENTANNTPITANKAREDTANKARNSAKLLYKDLSYLIQGAAIEIWKELGSGHKESIYQNAFAERLDLRHINYQKEPSIKIYSSTTNKLLGVYKPDFLVNDKIILELKAISFLPKRLEGQIFDYLKNSQYQLGYIINFGGNKLYRKRIIYSNKYKNYSR